MNLNAISRNERIVTGFFVLFFLVGLWLIRDQVPQNLLVIVFHGILLINTFFSIECFGKMTPPGLRSQRVIDGLLVLLYAVLPLTFALPSLYILLVVLLFLVASLKYTLLLGVVSDIKLLRRKISIDLGGALWNFFIFIIGGIGLLPVDLLLWIWVIVFALLNVYLLKIKPMYCLTAP
jgi:hypothetical protein